MSEIGGGSYDYNDDEEDLTPVVVQDDASLVRVRRNEEINVSKIDPTIREIISGMGWELKRIEGEPVDIDVSLFLLDKNDRTREDEDFVFYNNMAGRDGAVKHLGDSRTGAGDGDDEQIIMDLMALPFEITKIVFVLSIYDLDLNSNNFTMVKNVYFRLINNENDQEIFRFELDEDMGSTTALIIGHLERVGSDWMFKAIGEPVHGGLAKVASDYGIVVTQNIRS